MHDLAQAGAPAGFSLAEEGPAHAPSRAAAPTTLLVGAAAVAAVALAAARALRGGTATPHAPALM